MSQSSTEQACECENPDRGLFIWRGDPGWWSCVQCDGRVRPLTSMERAARAGAWSDAIRRDSS